ERERYFGALRCYAESLAQFLPQVPDEAPAAKWMGFMKDAFVRARSQFVTWARTGDPDTRDRATVLLTLGVFGDEALQDLFGLFRAEKDTPRRAQLALGLGKVARAPEARGRIASALGDEQQPVVRFALALALVGAAGEAGDEPPQVAVELLLALA